MEGKNEVNLKGVLSEVIWEKKDTVDNNLESFKELLKNIYCKLNSSNHFPKIKHSKGKHCQVYFPINQMGKIPINYLLTPSH